MVITILLYRRRRALLEWFFCFFCLLSDKLYAISPKTQNKCECFRFCFQHLWFFFKIGRYLLIFIIILWTLPQPQTSEWSNGEWMVGWRLLGLFYLLLFLLYTSFCFSHKTLYFCSDRNIIILARNLYPYSSDTQLRSK